MSRDLIDGALHVRGALTCGQFTAPVGSIANAGIAAAAGVDASKVIHQHALHYAQAPGTAIVAGTLDLHVARGAGEIVSVEAAIAGAIATGGDRQVSIALQRSTAGGAFATVLTAPLVLDNANVLYVPEAAIVADADYVAGDLLRLTVAVAGAAGAQGQGLIVTVAIREEPD